jgi:hypothetical protein
MIQEYLGDNRIITAYKGNKSDDYFTPKFLYDKIKEEFNINYDPAPYKSGVKMALFEEWKGNVFCNPPYSNIDNFLNKAMLELKKGNSNLIVFLLFARTGTAWFHKYIYDIKKNKFKEGVEVRFIRGRLKFGDSKNSAPDDSMIVIFRKVV